MKASLLLNGSLRNDPKNKDLVPAMTHVVTGASLRTLFHLEEEMMCRRSAAYVLGTSTDGLSVLTRLMREGDTWERQTAVFALDDLTETSNYPDGSVPAFRELIPELAKATKAKDRTLSCMADEVLRQIARGSNAELAALAKKYVSRDLLDGRTSVSGEVAGEQLLFVGAAEAQC